MQPERYALHPAAANEFRTLALQAHVDGVVALAVSLIETRTQLIRFIDVTNKEIQQQESGDIRTLLSELLERVVRLTDGVEKK